MLRTALVVAILGVASLQFTPRAPVDLSLFRPDSDGLNYATNPLLALLVHNNMMNNITYESTVSASGFPCDLNILNLTYPMKYYMDNSGKSPNDYGLWDACQKLATIPELVALSPPLYVKYSLVFGSVLPLQWGFCVPEACAMEVNTFFTESMAAMNIIVTSATVDTLEPVSVDSSEAIGLIFLASFLLFLGLVGMLI